MFLHLYISLFVCFLLFKIVLFCVIYSIFSYVCIDNVLTASKIKTNYSTNDGLLKTEFTKLLLKRDFLHVICFKNMKRLNFY